MSKFRLYAIFFMILAFLTSVTFAGQNADAKVALDLYSAAPTTTSNSGSTSLDGIGASADIYVKVYLQDVQNLFLYSVELLIDPNKLTWEKYGLVDFKVYSTSPVENNILNKNQTDILASSAGGTVPGEDEGDYKKIKIGAYVSTNRANITDEYAPDGEGLAGMIKLKTSGTFSASDKANIIVKQIRLEDNGQPSSVVEYARSKYVVAGVINPGAGEENLNTPVEKSITTNTSTITVEFVDGAKVGVEFTSGTGNAGKTATISYMGTALPDSLAADADKKAIEGKTASFYSIETDITAAFTADLTFTFTADNLLAAGLTTADVGRLVLAYFKTAESVWWKEPTIIDSVNMTATATVNHLSIWALVDSTDPNVVPVELMSFTARTGVKDGVILEWLTSSETNNYGFYIERSIDNKNFKEIDFVKGSGNSSKEISYSYIDNDVYEVGTYNYRLRQVDFDGKFSYSSIVSVTIKAPDKYSLFQAYPNPFNPITNIEFNIKEKGYVKLVIYNTLGQVVKTLVDEELNAGRHKVTFNAKNLASGIYIYKIDINGFIDSKKVVLVK